MCELCGDPIHTTSTQTLTIPVIKYPTIPTSSIITEDYLQGESNFVEADISSSSNDTTEEQQTLGASASSESQDAEADADATSTIDTILTSEIDYNSMS